MGDSAGRLHLSVRRLRKMYENQTGLLTRSRVSADGWSSGFSPLLVQDLPQFAQKRLFRERLLKEGTACSEYAVVTDQVARIA